MGQTVLVRLEGLSDVDGDLLEDRDWTFVSRPPGSAADFLPNKNRRFIIDAPGTYVVQRMVADDLVEGAPETVILTTNDNLRPLADAGPDQTVVPEDEVRLRGAGSSDVDGDRLGYRWALTTVPAGSTAALDDPAAVNPTFTADLAGSYVAQLIVDDGTEASRPDTVVVSTAGSPPVADAGPDQKKPKKNTIQLDGSASFDADGDALAYRWSLSKRPSASSATLNNPDTVDPTFFTDTGRRFIAQLIVNDGQRDSAPDTVVIGPGNMRPVAEAGPDQTVPPGTLVSLDGTGSFDAGDGVPAFQWALIAAPAGSGAALTGANTATPSFTADVAGVYVAQLIVTDDDVAPLVSDPDTVVIVANTRPVANAGADRTAFRGETVTLDGTGSSDPDGGPLSYAWTLVAQPAGSTAALSGADTAAPGLIPDLLGAYTVKLVVDDGTEASAPDTVVVTAVNQVPVANAGPDQTLDVGATVQLDGSGSADSDGDPLTYAWTLTAPAGSTAVLSDPAAVGPTFVADVAGDYVVQLIVNDGFDPSAPDSVTVIAAAANEPPVADAGSSAIVRPGDTVALNGSASSDPDGDLITFAWSFVSTPAGSTAVLSGADTAFPSFLADLGGRYQVQLVVNDGTSDSAPDVVFIRANTTPIADAGPDQQAFLGQLVQLDGTGTNDPDGDFLSVSWRLRPPSGSTATLSNSRTLTPSFTPDVFGTYNVDLTVTDFVDTVFDRVTVEVVNRTPVAEAGPAQTVTVTNTVLLDGSGSSDADGQPLTYSWFLDGPPGSSAVISSPSAVNPSFVPDIAGRYAAVLVVNDGLADSVPDAAVITATPLGLVNVPPVLGPIGNQSVAVGGSLSLTLTASDTNLDQLSFFASPVPLPAGMSLDPATGQYFFTPSAIQAGIVTVTFGVNDGLATDTETVLITVGGGAPGGATALTGRLLDANDGGTAVSGATVSLLDTGFSTTTDAAGNFALSGIPSGPGVLSIDGTTAAPAPNGAPYASLREDIDLIAGVTNVIDPALFLPRLDLASSTVIDPTRTTTVQNAALGASVTVFSNGAFNPDGTLFTGAMTISGVPAELASTALPPFVSPCNLVTIQPLGITFTSLFGGASISLPDFDNLPNGTFVDIWALDPALGTFSVIGEGQAFNGTISFSGLPFSGLVFAVPRGPSAVVSADHNADNVTPTALADGNFFESFSLPSTRSLGQDRTRTFVYNSTAARPIPILAADVTLPSRATLPEQMPRPPVLEARLEVGGLAVAGPVFTSTGLAADPNDPGPAPGDVIRQAISFDASGFPSGNYPYRLVSTAPYGCSRVGNVSQGRVVINNQEDSPFGAGWTLAELQRVIRQDDGRAVVAEGDGTSLTFPATTSAANFFDPFGFAVVGEPLTAAVDDLNNDGALDIAVADQVPGAVKVLLGDGTGGFTEAPAIASGVPTTEGTPPDTFAVASGDFNDDGIRDLVSGNQASGNLKVFIDNGDGTFLAGAVLSDFVSGRRPTVLAVGDLDRDGNDDIATSEVFSGFGLFIGELKVYYGDGTGGFPTSRVFSGQRGAVSVAIDDFNSDGLPDVALASDVDSVVSVFLNDRARGFTRQNFAAGPIGGLIGRTALATGDLDGDGDADLVVANQANTLSLLRNNGRGVFLPREALATGGPGAAFEPKSVEIADLDNDGLLDIVASGEALGNAAVLLGDGLGGFLEPSVIPVGSPSGNSLAVADFDANGLADLVVGSTTDNLLYLLRADPNAPTPYQAPPADFSTLVENADGTFTRRLKDGTVFEFDTTGLMTAEVDRNGSRTRYFYDAADRVTKVAGPTSAAPGEPPCPTAAVPSQDVTCMAYTGGKLSSVVDPTGRTTSLQVDSLGDLAGFTHPDGSGRLFAYDANHRLNSLISKRGFPTSHNYGFAGQWLGANLPDGADIAASISKSLGLADLGIGIGGKNNPAPFGRPGAQEATVTDSRGNVTTLKLNQFGSPVEITDPIGRVTTLTRNKDDLVIRAIRPSDGEVPATVSSSAATPTTVSFSALAGTTGTTTTSTVTAEIDYDERGNIIARREAVGTPLERENRFFYEPVFNNLTKTVDPTNTNPDPQCGTAGVTCFAYDATGNRTETTDALGTLTIQDYADSNCSGLVTSTTTAANRPGQEATTTFVYDPAICELDKIVDAELNETKFTLDAAGNVDTRTEGFGTPEARTTNFAYDAMNRATNETDGAGGTTTTRYDAAGNTIETEDATGVIVTSVYDALDRLVEAADPVDGVTRWTYDADGNVETVTDALERVTRFEYDAISRLTKIIDPALDERIFTYDLQDNLKTVQDARGSITRFDYDILARQIRQTNALNETWTFTYDSRNNLTRSDDPKGQAIVRDYDELSRLTKVTTITADGFTVEDAVTFTYDAVGNWLTAADNDSSLAFAYDSLDRVQTAETVPDVGAVQAPVAISAVYDAVADRRQIQDSLGGLTRFDFDGAGRLMRLTTPSNDNVDLGYDATGRLERVGSPNDVVSEMLYGLDGRIDSIAHALGLTDLTRLSYGYFPDGQVSSIAEPGGTRNFTYDAAKQLTAGGTSAAPESYSYDAEGNRISSHISANHVHDAANRMLEDDAFCYSYDVNGNLESKTAKVSGACTGGLTAYSWDVRNRLVRIDFPGGGFASYRYDALGRRIEKDVNGTITRYVYDREDIVLEFDGANTVQARYSYGPVLDQPLVQERGGQRFFYHADHQGSIRKITDLAGTVVNSYDYESFGRFETRTESAVNPFAFTGREFDEESGLYYYRFRYYDPATGRFLSDDPIGFSSGDLSLSRYVLNDPVNLTDAFGLSVLIGDAFTRCFAGAAGQATGGFFGAIAQTLIGGLRNALLSGSSLTTGALLAAAAAGGAANAGVGFLTDTATCGRRAPARPPKKTRIGGKGKIGDCVAKVGQLGRPNPTGQRGGPIHQDVIEASIQRLVDNGWTIRAGGRPPRRPGERRFGNNLPDIAATRGGKRIAIEVGCRTKRKRIPISRERTKLNKLRNSGLFNHVFFVRWN